MTEKKNWGEFAILMLTGAGIGVSGIFSEANTHNVASVCSPTTGDVSAEDGSSSQETIQAVTSAGSVAIGAGVSIIVFALSNKFNLLSTNKGRSIFMMMMAVGLIIIGGISLSIKTNAAMDESDKLLAQSRLGGIVLGFGLGIILTVSSKLIITAVGKGKSSVDDPGFRKKVDQLAVSGSTTMMALFATIVGSWSWNVYNKCEASTSSGSLLKGKGLSVINGITTVLAALLCVYSAVYFGFRAADNPIADTLANFNKASTAAYNAAGRGAAAAGRAGKDALAAHREAAARKKSIK